MTNSPDYRDNRNYGTHRIVPRNLDYGLAPVRATGIVVSPSTQPTGIPTYPQPRRNRTLENSRVNLSQINKPASFGGLVSKLVKIKISPYRAGTYKIPKRLNWEEAESWFLFNFSNIKNVSSNPNRNIDFIRRIDRSRNQYVECKLISGHVDYSPMYIRSSESQLNAMLENTLMQRNIVLPSMYALLSVDRVVIKNHVGFHYVITVWFVPVASKDDFEVINSAKSFVYQNKRKYHIR